MNKLQEFISKIKERQVMILLIVTSAITLAYSLLSFGMFRHFEDLLFMNEDELKVWVILIMAAFWISIILTIVGVVYNAYLFKKNKYTKMNKFFIASFGVLFLECLFTSKYYKAIKSLTEMNNSDSNFESIVENLFGFSRGYESTTSAIIFAIISIAILVLSIIFLKDKTKLDVYLGYIMPPKKDVTDENSADENGEEKSEEKAEKKIEIKPMSKETKKKLIIGLSAVAVIFCSYFIYDNFFNFIKIDLVSTLEAPTYGGYSGSGELANDIKMGNIDYDVTNPDIEIFLDTVNYSVDKDSKLSNGDKIKVIASYSKETAKNLKIKVVDSERTFKVKGLTERYKGTEGIKKEILDNFTAEAIKQITESRTRYSYNQNVNVEVVKSYFFNEDVNEYDVYDIDDCFVMAFKCTYDYIIWDTPEKKTEYIYVASSNVFKSTDEKDIELSDSEIVYCDTDEEFINELIEEYDDGKLTEFKKAK